ncbi:MAG: FAD-dependent oxidoreductase [Opitutaceae bacterium]|jgi:glycine oxidase
MKAPGAAAEVLIVGQGVAGTLLAWECERAGISFKLAAGAEGAPATVSRVAAGIINPVTGRRLVKSWRIDAALPIARAAYREIESAWGVKVWREMRVRRIFQDERERRTGAEKTARGELAPYVVAAETDGLWIEGAARVDLPLLLAASQEHWMRAGLWRRDTVDILAETKQHHLVVDCRGLAGALDMCWAAVPWEFSKGETLELAVADLAPDVIRNSGHWILPVSKDAVWCGATHTPGILEATPTVEARIKLEKSASELLGGHTFTVTGQTAGVRVNLPDRHPVVGRHLTLARLGLFNGLGSKGALLAPMLARQWINHVREGVPFDTAVDVARFF